MAKGTRFFRCFFWCCFSGSVDRINPVGNGLVSGYPRVLSFRQAYCLGCGGVPLHVPSWKKSWKDVQPGSRFSEKVREKEHLGGGNSNMFYFDPYLREDEPNFSTNIFQRGWNCETTNQNIHEDCWKTMGPIGWLRPDVWHEDGAFSWGRVQDLDRSDQDYHRENAGGRAP